MISAAEHMTTPADSENCQKSQSTVSSGAKNNGFGHHVNGNGGDDDSQPMETDAGDVVAAAAAAELKKEAATNGVNGVHTDDEKSAAAVAPPLVAPPLVNGHDAEVKVAVNGDGEQEEELDAETQQQLKKLKILDERNEKKLTKTAAAATAAEGEVQRLKREKYLKLKQLELDLKKEEAQLMLFKRLYYSQRLAPSAAPNTQQRNGIMNKGLPNKQQYLMQNQRGGNMNTMQQQPQQQMAPNAGAAVAGLLNKNQRPLPPGVSPNAALNRGPNVPGGVAGQPNRQSPQIAGNMTPGQRGGLNNLANKTAGAGLPGKMANPAGVTPTNGRNQGANSPMNLGK